MKVNAPKTEWQIQAEKAFLAQRADIPTKDAYMYGLTKDDVRNLSPAMQACLSLKCGSKDDVRKWRKQDLIKKFQRRPFDTNSPAVRIAVNTEKILGMREHLLRHPKHNSVKRSMSIILNRRQKNMKRLYKTDFTLYKHVCEELGIRCVRFAIPDSKDPSRRINPQAVDGDRARFLIRQRIFHRRNRPPPLREPATNRLIRYTRHPAEPVPASHGKAIATPQQVSRAWPYGVRQDRVEGKQVVYNPTAPGKGFWPASSATVGGPTPD